jgi:hypothetical protein
MRKQDIYTFALMASSLCWISIPAEAQSASQPPPASNPPASDMSALPAAPTPAPRKDKSKTATTPPANADQSAASDAPQTPAKKSSTADDNPFPEAISQKAAAAAKAEATDASTPDAPTPTHPPPTANQSQGSSSLDNTDKLGLDDPNRKQLKLESPDGSTDVYDPKRATEDVRVGKFYLQTGYFKGAYDRFKDATLFDHENVEAVFYLAEAARKLNMAKEAEQNYQLYLAAVPDGPSAKAARKALGELASNSKP